MVCCAIRPFPLEFQGEIKSFLDFRKLQNRVDSNMKNDSELGRTLKIILFWVVKDILHFSRVSLSVLYFTGMRFLAVQVYLFARK